MSWHRSYASRAAFSNDVPDSDSVGTAPTQEVIDQVQAARDAAAALIASKAAGDEHRDFSVHLHGHANPSHAPTPGWANDCIGVNVVQK